MLSARSSLRFNSLPETFNHYINLYSAAATAASVSLLALASPAAGEIVITNKSIPIPACFNDGPCPVSIDFNKDGITDLQFNLTYYPTHSFYFENLAVTAAKGAGVMAVANGSRAAYASCLLRSAKIGPSAHFKASALIEASTGHAYATTSHKRNLFGNWGGNHPNRFLGVKFQIKGKTHYGWVRITVNTKSIITATITEYGYETIANKRVSAGLPGASVAENHARSNAVNPGAASLGMLALGADSLPIWRREDEKVVPN